MFATLIPLIETTLNSVSEIQEVFMYPINDFTSYPSVVCLPATVQDEFLTNQENMHVYNFRIFVVIEVKQFGLQKAWTQAMPEVVDAIIDQFDADWDQGATPLEGHRIWQRVRAGQWALIIDEPKGPLLSVELDLIINLTANN